MLAYSWFVLVIWVICQASSFGSLHSSISLPEIVTPKIFVLMVYFFTFLSTLKPLFSKYFISSGLFIINSLIGAIIFKPELNVFIVASILTWSLPAPVQPCATNFAFSFFAISIRCFAIVYLSEHILG